MQFPGSVWECRGRSSTKHHGSALPQAGTAQEGRLLRGGEGCRALIYSHREGDKRAPQQIGHALLPQTAWGLLCAGLTKCGGFAQEKHSLVSSLNGTEGRKVSIGAAVTRRNKDNKSQGSGHFPLGLGTPAVSPGLS